MSGNITVFTPIGDITIPIDVHGNYYSPGANLTVANITGNVSGSSVSGNITPTNVSTGNIAASGGVTVTGNVSGANLSGNVAATNGATGNLVSGNHSITVVDGIITAIT
jgi:hypothetical protein